MPDAASVVRQIRAAGITLPILATQNMDGSYWLKAVPRLSNFYYPAVASVFGDDPDPAINQYVREFTKAYGAPPSSSYALAGAAILQLYKAAVERAGTTNSAAVAAQLNKLRNFPTVIGPVTYTATVHIVLDKTMRIMQIQDGNNSYLATWKPEAVPPLGLS
jgi:branched-chain amino acid transport system substrate-binding protein